MLLLVSAALAATITVEPGALVIQEKGWAPMEVRGITLPTFEPGDEGSCEVVLHLPIDGEDLVVKPKLCDTVFEDRTLQAARDWDVHVGKRQYYEQVAAMSLNFVFTGDEVRLAFDEDWIVSAVEARPFMVDTSSLRLSRTVVPRYPRELVGTGREAQCVMSAEIRKSGRPRNIEPVDCEEPFDAAARRAIRRWRWDSPRVNGEKTTSRTTVRVSFQAQ